MRLFYYSLLLTSFSFFTLVVTPTDAQYVPISLENKLEGAEVIIEGRVVDKVSFKGPNDEIYTSNTIEVFTIVKGEIQNPLLEVITMGGTYRDKTTTWTHLPTLSNGDEGIFFLKKTDRPCHDNRSDCLSIYAGSQGFYKLHRNGSTGKLTSVLDRYDDYRTLYRQLGIFNPGLNLTTFSNEDDVCLQFKVVLSAANSFNQNSTALNANLYVKLNEGFRHLYRSEFVIGYSGDFFGANIVTEGNLTYTDGELVTDSYTLTVEDKSDYELKIDLEGQTTDPDELEIVGEEYRQIASVTIYMQGWSNETPLTWDPDSNEGNYYIEADTELERAFSCAEISFQENTGINPIIADFLPKDVAAGVGSNSSNASPIPGVITIEGSGFTNPPSGQIKPDNMYVEFNTVGGGEIHPFEGDYISWSDEVIEVRVPSYGLEGNNIINNEGRDVACTGKIRICVDGALICGTAVESSEILTVQFSAFNRLNEDSDGIRRSVPVALLNFIDGGYTILNHSSMHNNTAAKEAFRRALNKWRCATGFNVDYPNELFPDNTPLEPGNCLIRFDDLPIGLVSATAANTSVTRIECDDEDYFYSENFIIRFNENIDWHYSEDQPQLDWVLNGSGGMQADFESTSLHELGHTHLLHHTCNQPQTTLMHSPPPMDFRREITPNALLGGMHLIGLSESIPDNACEEEGMIKLDENDCITTGNSNIMVNDLKVFPNPTNSIIRFNDSSLDEYLRYDSEIVIFHSNGKVAKSIDGLSKGFELDVTDLPPGLYLIDLISEYHIFRGKFIVL